MNKFGKTSTARLETCSENLQLVCREAIKRTPYLCKVTTLVVPDLTIICGTRNQVQQQAAFDAGLSQVKWPNSKHNSDPSMAVDVGVYISSLPGHIPWSSKLIWKAQHFLIKEVADELNIKLRYGIDFESFWDAPHIEEVT